jgi:hypothetical protein
MGTFSTVKRVAPGTLVAVAVLALLVFPSLSGAENGWIAGTIKAGSSDGPPLSGATVGVVNTTFSATTDAEGKYNISVSAGSYAIKVSATNHADKTSGTLVVVDNETTAYDTYVDRLRGSFSGQITDNDDQTAIEGASLSVEGTSYTATTDPTGRYTFESIEVGSYKVILAPPSPYPTELNFSVTIKASQNIVKDLKIKAKTSFYFTVKAKDGTPILGATVNVYNNQGASYSTTTEVDGVATLEVLPAAYIIKIQSDGHNTVIMDYTIKKGETKAYPVTLSKSATAGGGGGVSVLLIGGIAGAVVVVALVAVLFMRRKKAPAPGSPAGIPGGAETSLEPAAPGAPKTQAQKMKEWADFERMYGRPHPDAPGWVSAGAAAASAPKAKCPRDGISVTFEPFSGQYFCSRCDQRYTAEQVFRKEDVVLEESRPAEAAMKAPGSEEPTKLAAGEKLDLSTAQPSWALEHGQTMTGEDYVAPGAAAQQGAPPNATPEAAPPASAPMEAAPVSDDEPVAGAAPVTTPEGVNPEAGPLFNMPKPIDYSDLPPPPPPKEPPQPPE